MGSRGFIQFSQSSQIILLCIMIIIRSQGLTTKEREKPTTAMFENLSLDHVPPIVPKEDNSQSLNHVVECKLLNAIAALSLRELNMDWERKFSSSSASWEYGDITLTLRTMGNEENLEA